MSNIVHPFGNATVNVAANGSLAVYTTDVAKVYQVQVSPNYSPSNSLLGIVSGGETIFGPYTNATTLLVEAKADIVLYETGVAPKTQGAPVQAAPVAVDATGAVSATAIIGGIVTSTTAGNVAGTVPTGTVMDASSEFAVNDYVDWSVINTGGANTFTVTADTAHTVVGNAVVAASSSGRFRTRKTATNTFVTYRLS